MNNRYDFIFLFDCKDANPNGDPDAGNLPRIDAETGQGLVTDVCIKRKIRNFIQTTQPEQNIYFKELAVHNNQHDEAYAALKKKGVATDEDLEADKKKKPKSEIKNAARDWMCQNFYDVRTFGAVMSTAVNCGQVRGPAQLSFARSIDPIIASEHAITRSSVTNEKDIDKERTMGRKFTVPYGLYRTHGFVNPFLADDTGFSEDDLELFFLALENAFQFDQSAARPAGSMAPRALLIFKHNGEGSSKEDILKSAKLGRSPSHTLFDRLKIQSFEEQPTENGKPPRKFSDYASRITFDGEPLDEFIKPPNSKPTEKDLGGGITLIRRI